MARRTLDGIMASPPDVDRTRLAATTEEDIRRHAREDGHDPDGETDLYRSVLPPRAVRARLGLTQAAFAAALRVPIGTVRNWEQARTLPDPAARSLLDAVAAAPTAVLNALRDTSVITKEDMTHETEQQKTDASSDQSLRAATESPLAWMARRRNDGRSFIDAAAYEAAERLRRDIGQSALTPQAEADWSAPSVNDDRSGDSAAGADQVLAARKRVRAALDAVGTDLSGLLIDLCGLLKDLERIEAERRWPVRSAKVVACIALNRLAEHYGMHRKVIGQEQSHLHSWPVRA